ncbi:Tubulin-specific chaperone A [Psilocybe cubensis]|uniref:Tubulin-specific chaperone A n=2 Tax=Psilocybe cubensis TaxID=181762 RepID=A0ACB8HEW2_PSICU|nr:Tubulin-specific chaperone A [Psilocybe cubensis]KAH9486343.1 Tubulin-specific chaperone A [Psilocybe cubensis]
MSDTAALQRQLRIKTGVVQRLQKESKVYIEETSQLEARLAKLTAENADEWDLKNAGKMVDESKKMILDASTRLGKAVEDLQGLVTSTKEESALPADDEALVKAEEVIKEGTTTA